MLRGPWAFVNPTMGQHLRLFSLSKVFDWNLCHWEFKDYDVMVVSLNLWLICSFIGILNPNHLKVKSDSFWNSQNSNFLSIPRCLCGADGHLEDIFWSLRTGVLEISVKTHALKSRFIGEIARTPFREKPNFFSKCSSITQYEILTILKDKIGFS